MLRALCHCTICQAFNHSAYADITLFRAGALDLPEDAPVAFQAHRWPPLVQRGRCRSCNQPAVELVNLAPRLSLTAVVPRASFSEPAALPAPSFHLFYDRRVADVNDDLAKYQGYWRSQLAVLRGLTWNWAATG